MRPKVLLTTCTVWGVILTGVACSPSRQERLSPTSAKELGKGRLVGGPCLYSHYSGQALITRIIKTKDSRRQAESPGGPGYEGYEVWFVFEPEEAIREEWAHKSLRRECLFQLANAWYPGPRYLEKYRVRAAGRYRCSVKVITSGACTPVIFEFNQLRQDDYFESTQ